MQFLLYVALFAMMVLLGILLGKKADAGDNTTLSVLAASTLVYPLLMWWMNRLPEGLVGWTFLVISMALLMAAGMTSYWFSCPSMANKQPRQLPG